MFYIFLVLAVLSHSEGGWQCGIGGTEMEALRNVRCLVCLAVELEEVGRGPICGLGVAATSQIWIIGDCDMRVSCSTAVSLAQNLLANIVRSGVDRLS
jgi:hypothetical protein